MCISCHLYYVSLSRHYISLEGMCGELCIFAAFVRACVLPSLLNNLISVGVRSRTSLHAVFV